MNAVGAAVVLPYLKKGVASTTAAPTGRRRRGSFNGRFATRTFRVHFDFSSKSTWVCQKASVCSDWFSTGDRPERLPCGDVHVVGDECMNRRTFHVDPARVVAARRAVTSLSFDPATHGRFREGRCAGRCRRLAHHPNEDPGKSIVNTPLSANGCYGICTVRRRARVPSCCRAVVD